MVFGHRVWHNTCSDFQAICNEIRKNCAERDTMMISVVKNLANSTLVDINYDYYLDIYKNTSSFLTFSFSWILEESIVTVIA